MNISYRSAALFCILTMIGCGRLAIAEDGLNDIEIIPAGEYPVQAPAGQPVPVASTNPSRLARLASFFKLPNRKPITTTAGAGTSIADANVPTHVHKCYYSGRSEFQCPIIDGGRTRIVTVHPKTGEPAEFFVNLAAGAPRVVYKRDRFEYVYDDHRTVVHFPQTLFNTPRVAVRQVEGLRVSDRLANTIEKLRRETGGLKSTNASQAIKGLAEDGKNTLAGTGVAVDRILGGTLSSVRQAANVIPGKNYLQSLSEQRALDRQENLRVDAQRGGLNLRRFIPSPN